VASSVGGGSSGDSKAADAGPKLHVIQLGQKKWMNTITLAIQQVGGGVLCAHTSR
jgi:hypothetical protein